MEIPSSPMPIQTHWTPPILLDRDTSYVYYMSMIGDIVITGYDLRTSQTEVTQVKHFKVMDGPLKDEYRQTVKGF